MTTKSLSFIAIGLLAIATSACKRTRYMGSSRRGRIRCTANTSAGLAGNDAGNSLASNL